MDKFSSINPYTGKAVQDYEMDSSSTLEDKFAAARESFRKWSDTGVGERVKLITGALEYFRKNSEEIARDITSEMGKPLGEARGEVKTFFERAEYLCGHAEKILAPRVLKAAPGLHRSIEHVPLGVVVVISAWNYPLIVPVGGIITALLCGNTVLHKHSEIAPAMGVHFQNAFNNMAGYRDLAQHILARHSVLDEILARNQAAHVIFTGSTRGGREIKSLLAGGGTGCSLELGGKDAAYVTEDANLETAAATVTEGALYNAGQSCCSIERVYVHTDVYDAFLELCQEQVKGYRLGDPQDPDVTMGPLARQEAAGLLARQVREAVEAGARLVTGGEKKMEGLAVFFEPTLIADVNQSMDIMQSESFGPLLPVMRVSTDKEAVEYINESHYGLTAAVFTSSQKRAAALAGKLNVGTVYMNRCDYLDPALPWTGVKQSGQGSSLSAWGFYTLTRRKSIHFKTG